MDLVTKSEVSILVTKSVFPLVGDMFFIPCISKVKLVNNFFFKNVNNMVGTLFYSQIKKDQHTSTN